MVKLFFDGKNQTMRRPAWIDIAQLPKQKSAVADGGGRIAAATRSHENGAFFSNEEGALVVSGEVLMIHQLREEARCR